jgi:hypothetical protein
MKIICAVVLCSLLGGCAPAPIADPGKFEAAPSSIDARLDTASIEDYIIALPPFAYHEESVEQFVEQVRRSRAGESENRGMGADYLFVNGDGSSPAKGFILSRAERMLTIRSYEWEPGRPDTTETMKRVPGGWMRGKSVIVKAPERKP